MALKIPLYLTGVFLLFLFPPILSSPLIIDFLTTLLLLSLKMSAPPFSQYVDGMMGNCPLLNTLVQLVGVYLYDIFWLVILIEPLLESYLQLY